MSETKGSKFSIRDVITVAAMLVINYMIAMVVSAVTLPFSEVYLYGSAAIDGFLGAVFFLVAANRVNKHGRCLFGHLCMALSRHLWITPSCCHIS